MTASGSDSDPRSAGPFAPLRRSTYRSLLIAALASNIGDWMENVGSAWLMTELSRSATLVGLVQTSSSLPFVLLGLPAGALADIVDRRRLLIATQVAAVAVLVLLTILTASGMMTPALLLLFTFAIGVLAAAAAPAWQAIVPELVPRDELRSAVALNSATINVARAVGPALAGLLITVVGVAAVFLGNAVAFAFVVLLVAGWRATRTASAAPAEHLAGATRAGLRYARQSLELRAVLVRTALFALPVGAIWALLPLVARARFGGDGGLAYGVLLGLLGAGGIAGVVIMPRLRLRFSIDRLIAGGSIGMAAVLLILDLPVWPPVLGAAAVVGGIAWLSVVTNLNAATQFRLPDWVRARGLAVFQMVFQGSLAASGLVWGIAADAAGLQPALTLSAVTVIVGVLIGMGWPLAAGEDLNLRPASLWPSPDITDGLDLDDGPILVEVRYHVKPASAAEFSGAMAALERLRRRDGATRWVLAEDTADPTLFVESFTVESWAEHLRQHGRSTEADRQVEERVLSLQIADVPVEVHHLVMRAGN